MSSNRRLQPPPLIHYIYKGPPPSMPIISPQDLVRYLRDTDDLVASALQPSAVIINLKRAPGNTLSLEQQAETTSAAAPAPRQMPMSSCEVTQEALDAACHHFVELLEQFIAQHGLAADDTTQTS